MTILDFVIIGAMFLATLAGGAALGYIAMTLRQAKHDKQPEQNVADPKLSSYWTAEATDDC